MPRPGETRSLAELGLTGHRLSRRSALKAGLGTVLGAGAAGLAGTAGAPAAQAGLTHLAKANATRVRQFTGPTITKAFGAPYVDLCIPVLTRRGLLLVGGDTYSSPAPADPSHDWRAPTGLRASRTSLAGGIVVDGAVTDRAGHAKGLVPEPHNPVGGGYTTALPSDVFNVGGRLFLHLMRGPLYATDHSDFWYSDDDGDTWKYIRKWPGTMYGNQFQQKTYASATAASDPYVYVFSSLFNRRVRSGLLLFRVRKTDLVKAEDPAVGPAFAYQPWGYANGRWAWGNPPTSVLEQRYWGEICFRAMGGQYALSWFQPNQEDYSRADIRAMVFPRPTTDLIATTEQTMVYSSTANPASGGDPAHVQNGLYGGFIFPGSTFADFHVAVSNWHAQDGYEPGNTRNYVVSQWRTTLNPDLHP